MNYIIEGNLPPSVRATYNLYLNIFSKIKTHYYFTFRYSWAEFFGNLFSIVLVRSNEHY